MLSTTSAQFRPNANRAIDSIVVLRKERGKGSILEEVFSRVAEYRSIHVETVLPAQVASLSIDAGTLLLVRSSALATLDLEARCHVYPSEALRNKSRNKWALYEYCREREIATPRCMKPTELLERYVFKRTVGSNGSLVDPFAALDVVVQERIDGRVVKVYGHRRTERFVGYDEHTRKPVEVPPEVSALSRRVLQDYGLVFGGLDWIVADRWYLIDLNATSGFAYVPLDVALPLLSDGLDPLLGTPESTPC